MDGAVLTGNVLYSRRALLGHVDHALLRLRLQEALRSGVLALTVLLWTLVPLLLCDRLLSLAQVGFSIWIVWGALAALSIPYILWRTFSRRINEQLAAVLADDRLGLHSRLCTALALSQDDPTGFTDVFYAEAAARLARLDIATAFPTEMPRLAYLLPLPAIFAAGIWFMEPQDRMGWVAEARKKHQQEENHKKVAQKLLDMKLQDLKREVDEKPVTDAGEFKVPGQLLKKAQDIAKQIKEGQLNQEQALQALVALKREIGEARDNVQPDKSVADRLKDLKASDLNLEEGDLTRQVSEALKAGDAGLAAKEMRRLADKIKKEILDNPNKTPEQKAEDLKKLQKEMEKLAGALAEQQALSGQLQEISKDALDAGELQKLADQLKQQGGKNAEQLANELEQAIEQAADEMEQLEEDAGEDDDPNEEALDQLEDNVDEALDGL
jgi:hypothetical protein